MDSVYANPATKVTKGKFIRPASVTVELDCAKRKAQLQDSLTIDNTDNQINFDNIQ
jgi:hypothetical protein